ncbi:hypothetical protein [Gloeobacter morelensis]|uniref:DUF2259 domain-containing protein n=1 Tax=Gloeobacter morelensis MG652769 TaxID=2781736 RepID=A0ABY3PKN2_9CYAN|nr:hypothetical protein [Gloeobacter morelensis]UFP94231.1 hypothetical protein ISF26_21140 [Gloeobacter morelensis MG652769]
MTVVKSSMLAALATVLLPGAILASDENRLLLNGSIEGNETYSRLYLSSSAYVVKDRDFAPEQPRLGFFSTWIFDPAQDNVFEVRARYCVPDPGIDTDRAVLRQLDLLDGDQVLVSLSEGVRALPAQRETVRPAYYSQPFARPVHGYRPTRHGLVPYVSYLPSAPVFNPAVTCASGTTGFDLSPAADQLAALPDKTLKVRLHFSNGEQSGWQLGAATVRELKRLVAVRADLAGR